MAFISRVSVHFDICDLADESEENVALTTGEGLLPAVEGVDNGNHKSPNRGRKH